MAEEKKKSHYISAQESRQIAKENRKITKQLEKRKKRKNVEAEYLTEMKDSKNIIGRPVSESSHAAGSSTNS